MKKTVLSFSLFIALSVFAQKVAAPVQAPEMPVDQDTKLITYSAVVDVPATAKSELYKRAGMWFNSYYKNPSEIIKERDSVGTKMVGKPRFRINNEANENGIKTDGGLVQYTITVVCKDNKFKYTISEINWKQASYFPIEKWVEQKGKARAYNYYLVQTDSIIKNDITTALDKAMKFVPKKVNKDDW